MLLLVGIPSGDMTWALVSRRLRATLHEGVSCATFESKVICVSIETRSYVISGSKVVYDLEIKVAHEGNNYVECACGVEMGLIGLDMVSSARLNTVNS